MKSLFLIWLCVFFLQANAQLITGVEYFYDSDPGIGNGTLIAVGPSASLDTSLSFPITALSYGKHILGVRVKYSTNVWSTTQVTKVVKLNDFTGVDAEYFLDVDPGLSNGTPISFPVSSANIDGIFSVPFSPAITTGTHTLVIRTKTSGSFFSLNEARKFTIRNDFVNNTIEYFIDTDPGIGNGNFITVGGTTINQMLGSYSFNNVLTNEHILCFRVKTSNGNYSLTTAQRFFGKTQIASKEYFIDVDPGLGNGTPLPVSPNVDSLDITTLYPETGLTGGVHILVIRYQTLSGKWTLNEARPFTVDLTLAISLLIFSGQKTTHGNELTWVTETEKNHAYFELMRSADAIHFYPIATVPTKAINGNSNTVLDYSSIDSFPPNAINYYRLKMVDVFGKVEYSRIIQLDNRNGLASTLTVFSSNQMIHVFSTTDLGESIVNVYDLSGKIILSKKAMITTDKQTIIDYDNISQGIYIVQIIPASTTPYIYKLFIE